MIAEDLVDKVRRIEIMTRKVIDDMLTGQYRSHFKGHGVQFSEHRVYLPGDDVRHIDWKVSARTRDPLVKKFEEERELNVLLVVDISQSESFGSSGKLKSEVIAEIGGLLAYAASMAGDNVGAVLFANEVEKVLPPKRGRQQVLRIIRELLGHEPQTQGTNIDGALESANRLMKHAGIVFIISDFMDEGYGVSLKRLARKNDVVGLWIQDDAEKKLESLGSVLMTDPESGDEYLVDTDSFAFQSWMGKHQRGLEQSTLGEFRSAGVESIQLSTAEDYGEALVRFFQFRNRRR